jgi:arsenical pump membrane protein
VRSAASSPPRPGPPPVRKEPVGFPWFAVAVLGVTLVGFVLASLAGVEPVWIAAAGALALALHTRPPARELVGSLEPGFLVFVLALGIVVQAAGQHGLGDAAARAWSPRPLRG